VHHRIAVNVEAKDREEKIMAREEGRRIGKWDNPFFLFSTLVVIPLLLWFASTLSASLWEGRYCYHT